MLKDFGTWTIAVGKKYWAWLPSSAVAALLSMIGGAKGWNWPNWVYYVLGGVGFVYSFFSVWHEEYVANRNAPELTVDWKSLSRHAQNEFGATGDDKVTIRNTGDTTAVSVGFGEFSDENITWHRQFEVQTLIGKDSVEFKPEFSVTTGPHNHEIVPLFSTYFPLKSILALPSFPLDCARRFRADIVDNARHIYALRTCKTACVACVALV